MSRSRSFLIMSVLTILLATPCGAGESVARPPRIYFPCPLTIGEWQKSIGLTVTTLPEEIVEEEVNQMPAVDFHSRVGLPLKLSLDARILAQGLTNHFSAGARWSHDAGPFAFSIGYDIAWWFGFLTVDGFDNRANGWLNYPSVSAGYDFEDFRITAKAEAVLVLSVSTFAGDNQVSSDRNTFGGLSVTFAMEQPFWKDTHFMIGLKASYQQFFYQSWFVYETFQRFLFFPELSVGFLL